MQRHCLGTHEKKYQGPGKPLEPIPEEGLPEAREHLRKLRLNSSRRRRERSQQLASSPHETDDEDDEDDDDDDDDDDDQLDISVDDVNRDIDYRSPASFTAHNIGLFVFVLLTWF